MRSEGLNCLSKNSSYAAGRETLYAHRRGPAMEVLRWSRSEQIAEPRDCTMTKRHIRR